MFRKEQKSLTGQTYVIEIENIKSKATDINVELYKVCVVAPWMHVTHHGRAKKHKGLGPVFWEDILEAIVEHLTAYALAGIRETRHRIEKSSCKRQPSGKKAI